MGIFDEVDGAAQQCFVFDVHADEFFMWPQLLWDSVTEKFAGGKCDDFCSGTCMGAEMTASSQRPARSDGPYQYA